MKRIVISLLIAVLLVFGVMSPALAAPPSIISNTRVPSFICQPDSALIEFTIAKACTVRVQLINSAKKVAAEFVYKNAPVGAKSVRWDGKATSGNKAGLKKGAYVPAGTYIVRIIAGTEHMDRTMKVFSTPLGISNSNQANGGQMSEDDRYIYLRYDRGKSYHPNIGTYVYDKKTKKLLSGKMPDLSCINSWDGYLYCIKNNKIVRGKLSSGKVSQWKILTSTNNPNFLTVYKGSLYWVENYSNYWEDMKSAVFYRSNLDGSKKVRLGQAPKGIIYSFNIEDGYIYYAIDTGYKAMDKEMDWWVRFDKSIYRMKTSGGGVEKLFSSQDEVDWEEDDYSTDVMIAYKGKVYYLKYTADSQLTRYQSDIMCFDIKTKKKTVLVKNTISFAMYKDRLYYSSNGLYSCALNGSGKKLLNKKINFTRRIYISNGKIYADYCEDAVFIEYLMNNDGSHLEIFDLTAWDQ